MLLGQTDLGVTGMLLLSTLCIYELKEIFVTVSLTGKATVLNVSFINTCTYMFTHVTPLLNCGVGEDA